MRPPRSRSSPAASRERQTLRRAQLEGYPIDDVRLTRLGAASNNAIGNGAAPLSEIAPFEDVSTHPGSGDGFGPGTPKSKKGASSSSEHGWLRQSSTRPSPAADLLNENPNAWPLTRTATTTMSDLASLYAAADKFSNLQDSAAAQRRTTAEYPERSASLGSTLSPHLSQTQEGANRKAGVKIGHGTSSSRASARQYRHRRTSTVNIHEDESDSIVSPPSDKAGLTLPSRKVSPDPFPVAHASKTFASPNQGGDKFQPDAFRGSQIESHRLTPEGASRNLKSHFTDTTYESVVERPGAAAGRQKVPFFKRRHMLRIPKKSKTASSKVPRVFTKQKLQKMKLKHLTHIQKLKKYGKCGSKAAEHKPRASLFDGTSKTEDIPMSLNPAVPAKDQATSKGMGGTSSLCNHRSGFEASQASLPLSEPVSAATAAGILSSNHLIINEFVRSKERLIEQHSQYLKQLPTDSERLEARRQGVGPVLPHTALSSNAPTMAETMMAYTLKDTIKKERDLRRTAANSV